MNTFVKLLIALAAIAPLLFMGAIVAAVVFRIDPFPGLQGIGVVLLMLLSLAVYAAVLGYFLFSVHNNPLMADGEKTRWMMILFFWFPVGVLLYWYKYIWHRPAAANGSV